MKSALSRLGIRGFKPHLRKAPERLAGLRTAEGTGLPANVIEEFRRDMARLALVREQISSIEKTRAERLERAPDTGPHADSVGVALLDVPERQCAGAVVSHADRGSERRAQDDNDRGIGAQAADSAVAFGHDR